MSNVCSLLFPCDPPRGPGSCRVASWSPHSCLVLPSALAQPAAFAQSVLPPGTGSIHLLTPLKPLLNYHPGDELSSPPPVFYTAWRAELPGRTQHFRLAIRLNPPD